MRIAATAITVSADGTARTWGTGVPPGAIPGAVPIDSSQPVAVASDVGPVIAVFGDGSGRRYDPASTSAACSAAGPAGGRPPRAVAVAARATAVISVFAEHRLDA